ncbi:hypothetical protein [Saccharothrix carnea]|uniref:hypothetical protein n=1 Tax=Saccharothrix carnea TaxID=1280637 RepID=UPI000D0E02AA|nr:hypothetical protein [Saccharothrix carnea]
MAVLPAGPAAAATNTVAYTANSSAGTVSVLDTATNTATDTITVGSGRVIRSVEIFWLYRARKVSCRPPVQWVE